MKFERTKFADPFYHLENLFRDEVNRIYQSGHSEEDLRYLANLFAMLHLVRELDYIGHYVENLSRSSEELLDFLRGVYHD